jgi:polysaccharide biosynthesis PFTS motif protein
MLFNRKRRLNILSLKSFHSLRQVGNKCVEYSEIARKLSLVKFDIPNHKFWGVIPNAYGADLDLALRQNILSATLFSQLLPALMNNAGSNKIISVALPKKWRKYLISQGVQIKEFKSWYLFLIYQFNFAYHGIRKTAALILNSYCGEDFTDENYSVLLNIPANSLPNVNGSKISGRGFINWYKKSLLYNANDKIIVHGDGFLPRKLDNTFRLTNKYYPRLKNQTQRIAFLFRCLSIISNAFIRAAFGAWWILPLLDEAILLAYMEIMGPSRIAKSYIFHNSNWILRPLWTHYAETHKSDIIMVYYSTNIDGFKWRNGTQTPVYPTFETMSWPIYAIWDENQKSTLSSLNQINAQFHIVGPVEMIDNCSELPDIPKDAIGVFDVRIHSARNAIKAGFVAPYYTTKMARKFLFGCHEAITKNGRVMVLKQKREGENMLHLSYTRAVKKLSEFDNVIIIDAAVSAHRLIDKVDATISVPFTSTALISLDANKPSSYFDPISALDPNTSTARNLPVLDNVAALSNWIQELPPSANLGDIQDS